MVVAVAAALATRASAEDFHVIAIRDDAALMFDKSSIGKTFSIRRYDSFLFYRKNLRTSQQGKKIAYDKYSNETDCAARTSKIDSLTSHDEDGAPISGGFLNGPAKPVTPGSISEREMKAVCGGTTTTTFKLTAPQVAARIGLDAIGDELARRARRPAG